MQPPKVIEARAVASRVQPAAHPAGGAGPDTVVDTMDETQVEPLTDEELCALALEADPDTVVDDDAVCLSELLGDGASPRLPEWYMPAPMGGARRLRGWHRLVVALVIAAFLVITAYGLCNTYGQLHG
jgi:hypothetical protein